MHTIPGALNSFLEEYREAVSMTLCIRGNQKPIYQA